MTISDPDHADIYRRVEKVEIDVAVLDSKTSRLHEDMIDLKTEMKVNSVIAREVKTKVDSLPKLITIIMSLATVAMATITFLDGRITL